MLNYKNVSKGKYQYSELTTDTDKDFSVRSSTGELWFMHVICDLVNEKKLSEQEFTNFFESVFIDDEFCD
jgi:hypothetical protein